LAITRNILDGAMLDPDVSLSTISSQSAALQANDIVSLVQRAQDVSLERTLKTTRRSGIDLCLAGLPLSAKDIESALSDARSSYSDSIGAPKIPNVRWEDVGGLANVKKEILETVQLPLERPDLFAEGLKKRSGILLYGPPGTGKTLLAKAVATSCSLNFFSVKGPELLNMYIGESEANVRRVFQRARDASPCIIFMDELDSVAPKRGNQGDSGGVMDRIVSQLLAELDGMSKSGGGDVFVMGATNRPDLLDPALLRPGRFDRMLYLSVSTTNEAQQSILEALTRKFKLEEDLDLGEIAEACPFNYTGADFYALCSDAMLRAMTRKAEEVDRKIAELNAGPGPFDFPHPLTPQYYLASMASKEEIEVKVGREDFLGALEKLVPSVSADEMAHYERVQGQFKGYEIGARE
jgi:peroxin-6